MSTMNTQLVDDREYRRGMILGLTLAEVLLLLLFLLMLALGTELIELQERLSSADDGSAAVENVRIKDELEHTKNELAESHYKISVYEATIANTKMAEQLKPVLEKATKINPDDPPAALREAIDLRIKLGNESGANSHIDVDQLLADVKELNKLSEENDGLKSQLQETTKLNDQLNQILSEKHDGSQNDDLIETLESIAQRFEQENGTKPTTKQLRDYVDKSIAGFKNDKSRWPPIIRLSEANGHYFEKGSAALTNEFRTSLKTEIPNKLVELLQQYDVDTIEVIGHTDEQPIRNRSSNLDDALLGAARGGQSENYLVAADNAGLGMARAVSVMKVLRGNPALNDWEIVPLSGAQLIDSDGRLSRGNGGDIKERRRIEVRLRGSGGTINESGD